jgi:hypothetical protein
MYNRGDYILFSMRGRIADDVQDPVHGRCYIVECEAPANTAIRIPAENVDMRCNPQFQLPQVRHPFSTRARAGVVNGHAELLRGPRRPPSPIEGVDPGRNRLDFHRPLPINPPSRSFGPHDNWGNEILRDGDDD